MPLALWLTRSTAWETDSLASTMAAVCASWAAEVATTRFIMWPIRATPTAIRTLAQRTAPTLCCSPPTKPFRFSFSRFSEADFGWICRSRLAAWLWEGANWSWIWRRSRAMGRVWTSVTARQTNAPSQPRPARSGTCQRNWNSPARRRDNRPTALR